MYQRALNAAGNQGVQVVNLSIGSEVYTQTEALLIRRLIANRCVVVAAMGNEYQQGNPVEYRCRRVRANVSGRVGRGAQHSLCLARSPPALESVIRALRRAPGVEYVEEAPARKLIR